MFGPLHKINPLRLDWIDAVAGGLAGKRVLDVGCGGGILSEAMAARGATVLGIDLGEKALGVAKLHKLESGTAVDYRLIAAEALAAETPGMLRRRHLHGNARARAGPRLDRRGLRDAREARRHGRVLDDQPQSQVLRCSPIVGAEYVLQLLPRGTHDYAKFLQPAELADVRAPRRARTADDHRHDLQPVRPRRIGSAGHHGQLHDGLPPRRP